MNFLLAIKESPNYERLKNSVEMRYLRRNAALYGVITALFIGLIGLLSLWADMTPVLVIYSMAMLCLPSFYVVRILLIWQKINSYSFSQGVLDHPHHGGRDVIYYTVTIRDRMGRERRVDTHSIFGRHFEPEFEVYNNKTVTIAFNEETEQVVVIG